MPFVPSSQRLNTTNSSQIQVTEAINPIPTTQQQMINEESNNSQNSYENNSNANNNDLEDLLLTVLDELDTVKSLLLEQGIVAQPKNNPQPATETLVNKYEIAKELPRPPPQVLPNRNAHDFSNCF